MKLGSQDMIQLLQEICDTIEANKEYLNELDRGIGDGDHGVSMSLGCTALKNNLPSLADKSVTEILTKSGMVFLSAIGASVGPLYGTAMIRAGQAVQGKQEITESDLVAMAEAALKGIKDRGKAEPGDKTMVDAIQPAVETLKREFEAGTPFLQAAEAAVEAGRKGMESTVGLRSKLGRSSRLGDRSVGKQDAGATSSYLMMKASLEFLKKKLG